MDNYNSYLQHWYCLTSESLWLFHWTRHVREDPSFIVWVGHSCVTHAATISNYVNGNQCQHSVHVIIEVANFSKAKVLIKNRYQTRGRSPATVRIWDFVGLSPRWIRNASDLLLILKSWFDHKKNLHKRTRGSIRLLLEQSYQCLQPKFNNRTTAAHNSPWPDQNTSLWPGFTPASVVLWMLGAPFQANTSKMG